MFLACFCSGQKSIARAPARKCQCNGSSTTPRILAAVPGKAVSILLGLIFVQDEGFFPYLNVEEANDSQPTAYNDHGSGTRGGVQDSHEARQMTRFTRILLRWLMRLKIYTACNIRKIYYEP